MSAFIVTVDEIGGNEYTELRVFSTSVAACAWLNGQGFEQSEATPHRWYFVDPDCSDNQWRAEMAEVNLDDTSDLGHQD
jgi:hypothetical protein